MHKFCTIITGYAMMQGLISTVCTMCVLSNCLNFKKADHETLPRGFIKHQRSENSPSTMHNSVAEFQG